VQQTLKNSTSTRKRGMDGCLEEHENDNTAYGGQGEEDVFAVCVARFKPLFH